MERQEETGRARQKYGPSVEGDAEDRATLQGKPCTFQARLLYSRIPFDP